VDNFDKAWLDMEHLTKSTAIVAPFVAMSLAEANLMAKKGQL